MTTKKLPDENLKPGGNDARAPYAKPEIKRVDLALEETMSEGCKLGDSECTQGFPPLGVAGS
jgi:hypothetical protein